MNVTINTVDYDQPQHAADLIYLLDYYANDPMGGGAGLPEQVKANLVASLAQRDDALSLIAYYEGEPVGLLNAFEGFSTFNCKPLFNVHDIVVLEPFRRQGIAQMMLARLEAIARQRGCCKLTLEVLEGNGAAKQAYAQFGFGGYELDPAMGSAVFWQKLLR